ncbi:DUF2147 domain-containing protein [bacterium]|nr:DUF2147 domain-containing protein [candidate division CSSED10-310 bacterium]
MSKEDVSPIGKWKTIDDVTGREKSIVEIKDENGSLVGNIISLFREPGEDPNPVCDKCADYRKNQPVLGMNILWNLKQKGEEWSGGYILDPKNGKTYRCKLTLDESGDILHVRGFIGFALLGRTQDWIRVE